MNRWRYWKDKKTGYLYCWDTTPDNWHPQREEAAYRSFVMKPTGKGARSGKAKEWEIVDRLTVYHSKRSQARARATKKFEQARGIQQAPKRDQRPRYECSECGNVAPFYPNDYICVYCRDGVAPTEEQTLDMEGLTAQCMRERKKVVIQNPSEVTWKNGRRAMQGTCPDCGAKVTRMIGARVDA